jgi:predicted deacylase
VSVMVAKGARPGKRFTLTSGVHGDEMSSIRTVQIVMNSLDPTVMAGSVMAVFDVARPALESMQRRWPNQGRGIDLIDMNREWPGSESGTSAVSRHAAMLFERLLHPNTDLAIDFHTGTTGLDAGAFNIADRSVPDVKTMSDLFPVPLIWDNASYSGVLSNALINVGIPTLLPEIGAARSLNREIIPHFVEGTLNCLKHYNIVPGTIGRVANDAGVYIGNSAFPVLTTHGGFLDPLVNLHDKVATGQKIAVQRDAFGEVVAEYISGVDGYVGGLRSDVTTEPGIVFMFILFNHAPSEETRVYPE